MPTISRGPWLDPLNRMIWQKTFKSKATEMTLRDGTKFTIDYSEKYPGKAWVQSVDKSRLPCGWFDVEEVLKAQWISEAKEEFALVTETGATDG